MGNHWNGIESVPADLRDFAPLRSELPPVDSAGYFLTTERLGFRCWTPRDESLAIGLWCNPQVTRLIGGPWSREVALQRLAHEIEQQNQYGMQYWPVFLRADGRHVGCAGLRLYDWRKAIYEMGVHLLPEFWGQGIAREASEGVISFAFGPLKATAICAGRHPQNVASGGLLKKLGFAYHSDQIYIPTGLMHPTYLLRKEDAASV